MRRLLSLTGLALLLVAAIVGPLRAQVAGYIWQIAGINQMPVRTINVASGGTYSGGALTISAGGETLCTSSSCSVGTTTQTNIAIGNSSSSTTIAGNFVAALLSADLDHSSTAVNGQACALGGACSVTDPNACSMSGCTMAGDIAMSGHNVSGLADPTGHNDYAATVAYVNARSGGVAANSFFWSPVALAQSGMAALTVDSYSRTMGTGWEATLAQTLAGYEAYEGAIVPAVATLRIRVWRATVYNGAAGPWTQLVVDNSGLSCGASDPTYCVDIPYTGAGTYTGTFPTPVPIPAYGSYIYVITVWGFTGTDGGVGATGRTQGAMNAYFPGDVNGAIPVWGPAALYVNVLFYVDSDATTGSPPSGMLPGYFATIRPVITVP